MFLGAVSTSCKSWPTLALLTLLCLLSWISLPKSEPPWFALALVAVFTSYHCCHDKQPLCVSNFILLTLFGFTLHEVVLADQNTTLAGNITAASPPLALSDDLEPSVNISHNPENHDERSNETRLAAQHRTPENLSSEQSEQVLQPTEADEDLPSGNHTDRAYFLNSTQAEGVNATAGSEDWGGLSAGTIAGTTVGCLMLLALICGISLYIMWRHRLKNLAENKDQPSNNYTGLWDDSIMLSYINSQFDVPKEPYDVDMISLDNDAYLNSLESMIASNWNNPRPNTRF